ncbi:MAG: enoyl-CoA hydratase/isomerase family protein [Chloroflexi bacterium]|nr:enoyl-CoA hydratase/isomerase family protein [Chloroflexota bacterium]
MTAVLYEKRGKIAFVTINRPEAMNALNREVQQGLTDAWQEIESDPDIFVAILTGTGGRAFSAGADLKTVETGEDSGESPIPVPRASRSLGPSVRELSKPVIAAIDGYCLAGGLELALACDIRIATEGSQFGCPEVKWSLLHGFGAQIMPFTVHMSNMMELLLTGEFVDAQEAYRIGLISRVVSKGEHISTAEEITEKICRNAPLAIRATKELAQKRVSQGLEEGMRLYSTLGRLLRTTDDAKEGPRAFAEKRPSNFKGR